MGYCSPVRRPSFARVLVVVVALAAAAALWRARQASAAWPVIARANVLLVTIDTLRADRLTEARMPRLTSLARLGHHYPTTYSHAPLTLPAHASILTGLLPPAHGVRGNGAFRLSDTHDTLAERLKREGYRTGAFVGAFVLDARFGLAQGFDRYRAVEDDREFAADFAFAERPAGAVLDDAEAWLLEAPAADPWFAWVHLFDPHAPYDSPGPSPAAAYDGEVRRVDTVLGAFLDRLRSRGALDRTLIVLTADHGESLGAHGESTHGLFAYDTTLRVPLMIAGPGLGTASPTAPAAHIDIVPTVLDTLGLAGDPSLPGRSLRAGDPRDRPIYVEAMDGWLAAGAAPVRGVVADGFKLISVPDAELYDLGADPAEVTNIHASGHPQVGALVEALARVDDPGSVSPGPVPDARGEARLRSLGYASGAARPARRTFGAADDPKRVRDLYERFLTILATGTPDPAGLLALVRERPAFEAARLAAASWLIDSGRASEAVAVLEDAAAAPDASPAVAERLGAAWLSAGDPRRAAAVLAPVTTAGGASAEAWNMLGVANAQLGARSEARRALDTAVALAPAAARFRLNRALVRLEDGDRGGALDDASHAVALAPALADAWRLRATLHYEGGQRDAAIADWRRAVELDPADADSLFNLATALDAAGNPRGAADAAARYLALPSGPASAGDTARMRSLAAKR